MGSFSLENIFSEDGSEYANAFTLLGEPHHCMSGSMRSPSNSHRASLGAPDTLETYWDSRMDLLQRNISKRKDKLKMRAELALNEIFKGKPPSPDLLAENFEREVVKLKLKVCCIAAESSLVAKPLQVSTRMASLATAWQSAKVVRTREKISFFFGVMSLVFSALLFGLAPQ
jgi:hypothetical protein